MKIKTVKKAWRIWEFVTLVLMVDAVMFIVLQTGMV